MNLKRNFKIYILCFICFFCKVSFSQKNKTISFQCPGNKADEMAMEILKLDFSGLRNYNTLSKCMKQENFKFIHAQYDYSNSENDPSNNKVFYIKRGYAKILSMKETNPVFGIWDITVEVEIQSKVEKNKITYKKKQIQYQIKFYYPKIIHQRKGCGHIYETPKEFYLYEDCYKG